MAATFFTKVSSVIIVTQGTLPSKSYFGATGNYQVTGDNLGFLIHIGTADFVVALADLRINGQTPTTLSQGLTLLNAFFGT